MSGDQRKDRREQIRSPANQDSLVLIELPGGEERLEPLLDLGPRGVAVLLRANRPLTRGTVLPRLRLFARGECTLQSIAVVRELTPVELPDGTPAFKLGLSLEQGQAQAIPPARVIYREPAIIADALANLLYAKAELHFEVETRAVARHRVTVRLCRLGDDRSSFFAVVLAGGVPPLRRGRLQALNAELYGTRLFLHAEYRDRRAGTLRFAFPERIEIVRHRQASRLQKLPAPLEVELDSPFVRERLRRPVLDLSPRGLAVATHPADGLLLGMHLRPVILHLPAKTITASAIVRNVRPDAEGNPVAGLELLDLPDTARHQLEELVDAHFHPEVRTARPTDLKHLWPVYDAMGAFMRPFAAVSPIVGRIATVRQTLLGRGRQLCCAMLGGTPGEVHATAELLRTHGTTWSLQHVGNLPEPRVTVERVILHLVLDASRRADLTHLHALLDPARSRDGLARLRELSPAPAELAWNERTLLWAGPDQPLDLVEQEPQDASNADLAWVAADLGGRMAPLWIDALRLDAAGLCLDETDRLYRAAGLGRRRAVRLAMSVGGPRGYALVDQTSPGVSLDGTAHLVRLFVARESAERHRVLGTLAVDAVRLQRKAGQRTAWVLTSPEDAPALLERGFVSLGPRIEIVATKAGAGRLVNFLNLLA